MTTAVSVPFSGAVIRSEFADDPDFGELLEFFLDAVAEKVSAIQTATQLGHWQQLQTFSHQLKGSGAGYGFAPVTEVAARVERACKESRYDDAATQAAELIDVLSRLSR